VLTFQKAVSDKNERLDFYLSARSRSTSSLFSEERNARKIQIEAVSLDDFLDDRVSVDIVKMDIEGGEVRALKGMGRLLKRSPRVTMFVECNPQALQHAGSSVKELFQVLRDYGFHALVIDEEAKCLRMLEIGAIEGVKYVNLFCQRPSEYAG
jgi:hypothetical protein